VGPEYQIRGKSNPVDGGKKVLWRGIQEERRKRAQHESCEKRGRGSSLDLLPEWRRIGRRKAELESSL